MLTYVNCISGDVTYTTAINPKHVVSITEIKPNDSIKATSLISLTTGREHFSDEYYLDLVAKLSAAH